MKKNYLMIASAALVLAGCANDDFVGEEEGIKSITPMTFNLQTSKQTRATSSGKDAATALGNMFIVWGEKNETDGTKASEGNVVFKNYVVKYTENSANTSTSNTKGWEYVAETPYKSTVVSPSIIAGDNSSIKQTIKYWDDNASQYTFTAVSAKADDLNGNSPKVIITKNEGEESSGSATVYDKGYTIQVKSGASTGNIYVSDRKVVTKEESSSSYKHEVVQLTFRNFESKIRFGIYETVPGYKVVITGLKYKSASNTDVTHPATDSNTDKTFGITGNFIVPGDNTKYKVTYGNAESGSENKAKVEVVSEESQTPSSNTYCNTSGTEWLSTSKTSPIGTSSLVPTYDATSGAYTSILPNPSNSTNLTLTISYELYSEDAGEKISVDYTSVEVPAQYCQWKSNYAYTYLFKITDASAGLYPITFDAVVETDEIGNQETITTVSDPSITTFGYDISNKKIINAVNNEYKANDVIYACVLEKNGTSPVTLSVAENNVNVKLYTVESSDTTYFPITEASVAQSLSATVTEGTSKKITTTAVTIKSVNGSETDTGAELVSSVPDETPNGTREVSALKWTAEAGKVYAIEYIKKDSGNSGSVTKTYKIVKVKATEGN